MHPWLARRWYDAVFWGTFMGFGAGWSLRVAGRRHMPATGPVLVVSNHQSFFDPVLVGLASRRYLAYLARKTLFKNRYLRGVIESLDAIPIDQEGLGIDGLKAVLEKLSQGKAVLVFPEGHRTFDGGLQELMAGVTLLVKKVKAPIVPVGIAGAFDSWPREAKWPTAAPVFLPPWAGTIGVSIGEPIDPTTLQHLGRDGMLAAVRSAIDRQWRHADSIRRGRPTLTASPSGL